MSSSPPNSSSSNSALPKGAPPVPPPTLDSIGLSLVPLTQPLSTSRNSQPLCGALLDDKYILIGTTGGLDFLPIPLPGSLPMRQHGKKRRETRKPIPLIKRTRFKELAVLSERSNILLAIAGRNDHIRVYALDGIRAMIEKKMAELDMRDGYPIIPDPTVLNSQPNGKGKARAEAPPSARATGPAHTTFPASTSSLAPSSQPYHFPTTSPPPDYAANAPIPSPVRRRPPPLTSASMGNYGQYPLPSPVRATSTRISPGAGNIVRAVPTNPRPSNATTRTISTGTRTNAAPLPSPRTLRSQRSREFVAPRKGSSATITKHKSRTDLNGGDSASVSAASHVDSRSRSPSPIQPRLAPRAATMPRPTTRERSPILELAETIRTTGPEDLNDPRSRTNGKGKEVARPSTAQGVHPREGIESGPLQRSVSARARLVARPATARSYGESDEASEDLDPEVPTRRRGSGMSFADVLRDGPPPGFNDAPPPLPPLPTSSSAPLLGAPASPGNRSSKRWTMSGMGSKFLSRPGTSEGSPTLQSTSRRGSVETRRSSLQCDPNAEPSTGAVDAVPIVAPAASASTAYPPHDFKRPTTAQPQDTPTLPASSQVPPEAHPANSNSPLEYVKLARTKGARLLRAVETKKRTYLAVLCGDEGERIELFTGSRSISLSLNRTFVLPENPRTIEFQIQGDDLIDICPARSKLVLPYSTFQQLPFVPPVPSSVLASAWIIPPLYTDVIGSPTPPPSGLHPSITVTGDLAEPVPTQDAPPPHHDYPLLSPISLLGGAAHRANGPPGLFFVCRSRNLSGIVTGDGRSVIKKPLVWSLDKPADGDAGVDVIRRIEMLIVGGTKTVILGIGNSEVKAIAVGGAPGEAPFGAAVSLTPTTPNAKGSTDPRDIVFLGTHSTSNQLFFTERVGQASWRAWCVGTRE
ncbi:hypothetical protein RQP46_005457 [Phenoliferia psychrophenolica]